MLQQQDVQDPADDVIEVVATGAQVGVVHLVENLDQGVPMLLQRPFGAQALIAYQIDRLARERLVLEHQQMGVDELCNF